GAGISAKAIAEIRANKRAPLLKRGGGTYFASSGNQKMLVILATFSDQQPFHSRATINAMMNEEGYNGTGSFSDYYKEVSGGQLEMEAHVTVWVTVPNTREYYAADTKWSEFAYQAVKQASLAGIDLSIFDNDGDGVVEGIAIIHQGPGQEVTGDLNDIWSHSYSFSSAGYSRSTRTFNGVKIDQYTVQPETRDGNGSINTIGVICHEFGHNLGLPDFYDTNDETDGSYEGTGRWDVMSKGNYNGSPAGSKPAHHNPFSKIELGWADEVVISAPARRSLSPIISSQEVYRINGPESNEYMLLENRQKHGFDASLPGHGLVAYHVDASWIASKRYSNTVNTGAHQGLYVKAAGENINTSSAPFPGFLQNTQFTDQTEPAMRTWSDLPYNRSVTGIQELNGVISFDFMALQNGSPITLEASNISSYENKISWTPSEGNDPVLLAWSPDGNFGTPISGASYSAGQSIAGGGTVLYYGSLENFYHHTGLEPASYYHYSVWSNLGATWSGSLTTQRATPAEPVTVFPWIDGFETDLSQWYQESILGNYHWEIVAEGIGQKPPEPFDGSGFASFFVDSDEVGSTRLVSPTFMLDTGKEYNLDFYHVQSPWKNDQDELEVYIRKSNTETWEELDTFKDAENEWHHRRYRLPYSEPIEISFIGEGNYGHGVGLDQVEISEGQTCETNLVGVSSVELLDSTENTMQVSWSLEVGESVMVVARKNKKMVELPDVGAVYSDSAEFGVGDSIGPGAYVVYAGSGSEVSITGLEHTTDYYFSFFAFDNNYCYQIKPLEKVFSTVPVYYNMSLEINDGDSPIEGTGVLIDGSEYSSDSAGKIYWAAPHDTLYYSVEVSAVGYKPRWIRYNAVKDTAIIVSMQTTDDLISVRNVKHQKKNNLVTLSWDPVIDESFEGYEPFSISMQGWTQLDHDKASTYSIKDHDFINENYVGSFIVMNPHYEGILQTDHNLMAPSGKMLLAAFAAVNVPNDDWLISPPFIVQNGDEFSVLARSLTDKYGFESFRVLVSVQEPSVGEFVPIIEDASIPVEWTLYKHSLNDYVGQKIKVAVHYNSYEKFALLLDDIRVGPATTFVLPAPTHMASTANRNLKKAPIKSPSIQKVKRAEVQNAGDYMEHSGMRYIIRLNGDEVGSVNGFTQNQFSKDAETCDINIFNVRTDYLSFDAVSSWSDDYEVTGCFTVKFIVKNIEDDRIEGASVIFNGEEFLTNNNGEVIFDGVASLLQHNYEVNMEGYLQYKKTLSLTSDLEVIVTMNSVVTDSMSLSNGLPIVLYPNPLSVSESLKIDGVSAGIFKLYFYNLEGRLIHSQEAEGGAIVTLDNVPVQAGIYVVKIMRGNKSKRIKLIVL
ncbi:MAG TPA: M6 family metalloprotease domain-containing protein, partial [Marinilabiliaceae bacterium]|nr:M6 family metalloprotease domain-containing protein [Marinilabiliaceae bacterium]